MKTHQLILTLAVVAVLCALATANKQAAFYAMLIGVGAYAIFRNRYVDRLNLAEQQLVNVLGKERLCATSRSFTDLVVYVRPENLTYAQERIRPLEEVFGVDIRISTKGTTIEARPVEFGPR